MKGAAITLLPKKLGNEKAVILLSAKVLMDRKTVGLEGVLGALGASNSAFVSNAGNGEHWRRCGLGGGMRTMRGGTERYLVEYGNGMGGVGELL